MDMTFGHLECFVATTWTHGGGYNLPFFHCDWNVIATTTVQTNLTYWVVFLFYFSLSCVPCVASFSGLSFIDYPFGILTFI